jgi:hypothetical protein
MRCRMPRPNLQTAIVVAGSISVLTCAVALFDSFVLSGIHLIAPSHIDVGCLARRATHTIDIPLSSGRYTGYTVKSIITSCTCMSQSLTSNRIIKGKTEILRVFLDPVKPGKFTATVDILYLPDSEDGVFSHTVTVVASIQDG